MLEKIFSYSTDNASAATSSENDLPLTAVKKKLSSEDNQQGLTEIRNMLQQISSHNHQYHETELNEWIDGYDDLLPQRSDESVSSDETVTDEPKVKHEGAISSFNTCIKCTEENGAELEILYTLRLMPERVMEIKD
ncbi:hypothetical protein Trydic_g21689 [Trypoxylus dichotomus]